VVTPIPPSAAGSSISVSSESTCYSTVTSSVTQTVTETIYKTSSAGSPS
jgi:hypothetical protein